jgi:Cdc6-like AAA superfamily ATPase
LWVIWLKHCETESRRQNIYKWLEATDPSPLHHQAQRLLEPGTCEWILLSSDWTNWLGTKIRCLWIHGIPGAGKTILASHLIEEIKSHCAISNSSRVTYVYYYCHHGHNQDEVTPFLRWVICRLCRQSECVPVEVHNIYKQGGQPSLEELLDAFASVVKLFGTVYIVVDAVDESNTRLNLLRALKDLVKDPRFEMIQLLATSRRYIDIGKVMKEISISISMSNPLVEDDIRLQVRSTLHSHPKFKHWPEHLLNEVEDTVSEGAKGMYVAIAIAIFHERLSSYLN